MTSETLKDLKAKAKEARRTAIVSDKADADLYAAHIAVVAADKVFEAASEVAKSTYIAAALAETIYTDAYNAAREAREKLTNY